MKSPPRIMFCAREVWEPFPEASMPDPTGI
jgi:hypothetical protein